MELLDAAIALAITVAAFATTVTIAMEIFIRFVGLKSKGQVQLFSKIFESAVADKLLPKTDKDKFLASVLKNPLVSDTGNWELSEDDAKRYLPFMFGRGKKKGIYEWVSHEHVLRRLLAVDGMLGAPRSEVKRRLRQFMIQYDQLCGAASVEFKTNRQFWSIIGGILLAVVLNVDGLRIFRSYMQNPALAGAMAARIEDLERVYATAAERLEEASDGEGESSEQEIEAAVERLRGSVEPLLAVGVPIGWRYAPHCHLVGLLPRAPEPATDDEVDDDEAATSSDSACIDGAEPTDWIVWLGTLVSILGTGVLIGLGAPFWFDVARRLAVVRTLFGAVGGGQDVHRGETLEPGPQKDDRTDALIDRVVADAYAGRAVGARRLLIDGRDV